MPLKQASKQNNRASPHTPGPACYCPRHPKCLPGSSWFPKTTWRIKSPQRSLLHKTTFSTTNERIYKEGWGAAIGLQVQRKFCCVLGVPVVTNPSSSIAYAGLYPGALIYCKVAATHSQTHCRSLLWPRNKGNKQD